VQTSVLADSNFLIPNGTFIAELVLFLIILAVVYRFVVPPLQGAMRQRHDLIRRQFEEAAQAKQRAEAAQAEYAASMSEARAEGARIRDEARVQGQQIIEDMRAQAQQEVDTINAQGREQLAADRESMIGGLRSEMATLAVELAGRIVGESLIEQARTSGTVERFMQEHSVASMSAQEPR